MTYDDSLSRRIDPATAAAFHPDHLDRYRFAAERAHGLRVLDVGCATGYGSAILAEDASHVTAIDVFEEGLHYARATFKRPNLTFRRHDIISDAPLNAAPFDVVVCFEVIEHVERPVEMLKAMARHLGPEGILCFSTPNGPVVALPDGGLSDPTHVREYSPAEVLAMLADAGLEREALHGQRHGAEALAAQEERARAARYDVLGLRRLIPARLLAALSVWYVGRRLGRDPRTARSIIDDDWETAPILLFTARHRRPFPE